MQLASCTVRLTPLNEVHKASVTPAEVYILRQIHGKNAGGDAVVNIKTHKAKNKSGKPSNKDVEYNPPVQREVNRLRAKYGKEPVQGGVFWVEKFYPGANPQLPQTFEQVEYVAPEQTSQGEAASRDLLPGEPGYEDKIKDPAPVQEPIQVEEPEPASEGELEEANA